MLESISEKPGFWANFQRLNLVLLSTIFLSVAAFGALAQPVHEPGRGTAERKAVLDAVRPLLEARLGAPVEFVVDWMQVGGGWAFVGLAPQRPGGAAIDLRQTTYAEQSEWMDGIQTYALLKHQYNRWNIVDYAIGPTDVFWQGDPLYAQLPIGLTPY
ncbi:MAG: hypothetical protein ABJL55_07795 [Roseibium sp.]